MRNHFGFPDTVDDHAARLVASGVLTMAIAYLATGWVGILVAMAYGFVARVVAGPRYSPLASLVTRVVVPALGRTPKIVPGPPKRFAQAIGATATTLALVAHLSGSPGAAQLLIGAIVVAASLEAVAGFCLGCWMFSALMRMGVIPERVCLECADISSRLRREVVAQ